MYVTGKRWPKLYEIKLNWSYFSGCEGSTYFPIT
jgi:hypothetical protein